MDTQLPPLKQDIGVAFLEHSCATLERMQGYLHRCLDAITEEQVWLRGSDAENAVGNVILHLCGNVRQWIGSYVGGLEDIRDRPKEFATPEQVNKAELLRRLDEAVSLATGILRKLDRDRLGEVVPVQDGKTETVLGTIYHVVGHFQQHTGQVVFAVKQLTGAGIGLYQPPQPVP